MEQCHFCKSAITFEYYRVADFAACVPCVDRAKEMAAKERLRLAGRGMLFGLTGMLVGSVILWLLDEVASRGGGSILSLGAFLRGTGVLLLGIVVGGAAHAGAKKKGSRPLQVATLVLTYLGYCLSFTWFILAHSKSQVTGRSMVGLVIITPVIPFLLLARSLWGITGLVVLVLSMRQAWALTANRMTFSGPYPVETKISDRLIFSSFEI